MAIGKDFAKRMAAGYTGDPQLREQMIQHVQNTLDTMAEIFAAAGFRDDQWHVFAESTVKNMGQGFVDLFGSFDVEEDNRDHAEFFVDHALRLYSMSWEYDESQKVQQLGDALVGLFKRPAGQPTQEQIEAGEFVPGVDKTPIEAMLANWDQAVHPKLLEAAKNALASVQQHLAGQYAGLQRLAEQYGADKVASVIRPYLESYLRKRSVNVDLAQFSRPTSMAVLLYAFYQAGALDPYDFDFSKSDLVSDIEDTIREDLEIEQA